MERGSDAHECIREIFPFKIAIAANMTASKKWVGKGCQEDIEKNCFGVASVGAYECLGAPHDPFEGSQTKLLRAALGLA